MVLRSPNFTFPNGTSYSGTDRNELIYSYSSDKGVSWSLPGLVYFQELPTFGIGDGAYRSARVASHGESDFMVVADVIFDNQTSSFVTSMKWSESVGWRDFTLLSPV